MSKNKTENRLIKKVMDQNLIDYFYLNLTIDQLIDKLHNLKFTKSQDDSNVPFNAQIIGYTGAIDSNNDYWIIKKIETNETFSHRLYELAYYIDFMLQTFAVPSILVKIDDTYYRASKLVLNATQISGYNYIENPFKKVLLNDLINRWLFFDEDRNPNNYMVIHNLKQHPLIIAIDYNKIDLETESMKITGNNTQFGWYRKEKTRFLTLLKPSNFENLTLNQFDFRLNLMMHLSENQLTKIGLKLFKDVVENPIAKSQIIISNIMKRRNYINHYFRTWFKNKTDDQNEKSDYSDLGKSFLKIYKE